MSEQVAQVALVYWLRPSSSSMTCRQLARTEVTLSKMKHLGVATARNGPRNPIAASLVVEHRQAMPNSSFGTVNTFIQWFCTCACGLIVIARQAELSRGEYDRQPGWE